MTVAVAFLKEKIASLKPSKAKLGPVSENFVRSANQEVAHR